MGICYLNIDLLFIVVVRTMSFVRSLALKRLFRTLKALGSKLVRGVGAKGQSTDLKYRKHLLHP